MNCFREDLRSVPRPTEALATAASRASVQDVSSELRARLKHSLLDWLGVALAGATRGEAVGLRQAYQSLLTENFATVLRGGKASTEIAAFLNAFAGHILDFDDVIVDINGHPSAVVVPAVLAAAEPERVSGIQLLDAIYAGMETVAWLGLCFGSAHYRAGWHATSVLGVMGATAGIMRLHGATPASIQSAIGLAGAFASGIQGVFGTHGKPLQVAGAASSAIRAVRSVKAGLSGPHDILERPSGLFQIYSAEHTNFQLIADRQYDSPINKIVLKQHASCFGTHAAVDAIAGISTALSNIDAIERILVALSPQLFRACNIRTPKTGDELKFSLSAMVALAVLGYDTTALETYRTELAQEASVRSIINKIEIVLLEDLPSAYSKVSIRLRTGETLSSEANADSPVKDIQKQSEMVNRKFIKLAKMSNQAGGSQALVQVVQSIESFTDTSVIWHLLQDGAIL